MKSVCILRCGQNIMIVTIPLDSADMHSNDPPHLLTDLKEPAGLKSIVPPPPILTKKQDLAKYSHPRAGRTAREWITAVEQPVPELWRCRWCSPTRQGCVLGPLIVLGDTSCALASSCLLEIGHAGRIRIMKTNNATTLPF